MSFDLPLTVEHELEEYARAERISPAEAVVKLVQDGLRSKRRKVQSHRLTEEEWAQLRQDPLVAFFERMPDGVFKQMEAASKQIHSERYTPRG